MLETVIILTTTYTENKLTQSSWTLLVNTVEKYEEKHDAYVKSLKNQKEEKIKNQKNPENTNNNILKKVYKILII